MHFYNTYGFKKRIEDVVAIMESSLKISFEMRDSSYRGEYYKHAVNVLEHILVERNYNELNDSWSLEDKRDFEVLVSSENYSNLEVLDKIIKKHNGVLIESKTMTDVEFASYSQRRLRWMQ